MQGCDRTVTIVHRIAENGADRYTCTVVRGASWYWQNKTTVNNGLQYARLLQCRIPLENQPDGLQAAPGDKVVLGVLDQVTGKEFAALCRTYEGATILGVHDNNARPGAPHLYIEGA